MNYFYKNIKKTVFIILLFIIAAVGWFFIEKYYFSLDLLVRNPVSAQNYYGGIFSFFRPNYYGLIVPSKPSEAFNMSGIKNASLGFLGSGGLSWRQSSENIKDDVKIIDGNWSPGIYIGPTADGKTTKIITLASRARIYFPQSAVGKKIPVLVKAVHLATLVGDFEDNYIKIAKNFNIAIIVHGEKAQDWNSLGYKKTSDMRGALINDGIKKLVKNNLYGLNDLQTGNFSYALARTNMLSLTLAQRLLEKENISVGNAGIYGGSKEGFASWVVSAVDDRFNIAAPQGFQNEDRQGIKMLEKNSGCGPNGSSQDVNIPAALSLEYWLENSVEGQKAAMILEVSNFINDLKPEFLFLGGDVGMPGMHDGIHFTIGADTHFIENFNVKPFRYDLWAGPGTANSSQAHANNNRKLAIFAQLLSSSEKSRLIEQWVKVEKARAFDDGKNIIFEAAIAGNSDISHVYAYWNQSPNREFNDLHQEEWKKIELFRVSDSNIYKSKDVIIPEPNYEIAWYVEVQENDNLGGGLIIIRKDASPIKFLRELPARVCDSFKKN